MGDDKTLVKRKSTRQIILDGLTAVLEVTSGGEAVGTAWEQLGDAIASVRKDIIDPTYIQGSLGLGDDPSDEIIAWALLYLSQAETVSDYSWNDLLERAIWSKEVNWRSIGTDAGPTQVLDDVSDFLSSKSDQFVDRVAPYDTMLILACRSSTSSTVRVNVNIAYTLIMEQTEWADNPSEWAGYTNEELGMTL